MSPQEVLIYAPNPDIEEMLERQEQEEILNDD